MTSLPDLTVASYNIHKGIGTDRRRDLARTVAVISEIGADILALQEADTRFGQLIQPGRFEVAAAGEAEIGVADVIRNDA